MHIMNALSIAHLSKSFGTIRAVSDFTLDVQQGLFVTLLGPSGSGKSTVLRLIAGFETPDRGRVAIDGVDVTALPPHQRPSSMMFQRYALFPHVTVRQNIAFGLKRHRFDASDIRTRVDRMLDLVHLADRADHFPHQLSGGQEQRAALARSLVLEPRLLLLDEPLAALDAGLRKRMRQELKDIQRQTGITFVSVTHDQDEALSMSDRIVVMHAGEIMQQGTPEEIFERPRNRFVAEFMGAENIFPGIVRARTSHSTTISTCGTSMTLPIRFDAASDEVGLVIRPEALTIGNAGSSGWSGRIIDVSYKGSSHLLTLALHDGTRVKMSIPAGNGLHVAVGATLPVSFDPERAALIPLS